MDAVTGHCSDPTWQMALSTAHAELLTIIQEAEGQKRELFNALEASVRTAEQLQAIRTLEYQRNKRASKENEAHIQSRLQNVRKTKKDLKVKAQEWDRVQAQRLAEISGQASESVLLPRVLEEATNTLQLHRAERVDAQVRAVALEEELRIVKDQQSEAEHARVATAGELEILKMKHETLLEQHKLLQHELTHAKTVAEAATEGAQYYRAQLDESTFRQQAAEGHVVQLQQTIAKLQRDAAAEKNLLQSLQSRWAESSKHIEEAAIGVADVRAAMLADVACQTEAFVATATQASGASQLHSQIAASWRREEKWRAEKAELLGRLQATGTQFVLQNTPRKESPANCTATRNTSVGNSLAHNDSNWQASTPASVPLASPSRKGGSSSRPTISTATQSHPITPMGTTASGASIPAHVRESGHRAVQSTQSTPVTAQGRNIAHNTHLQPPATASSALSPAAMNAPGDSNHLQHVRHCQQPAVCAERPAASRTGGIQDNSAVSNKSEGQLLTVARKDGKNNASAAQRSTPQLKSSESPCLCDQKHAHIWLQESSEASLPTPGAKHLQVIRKPSTDAAVQHAPNSVHSLSLFSAATVHSATNRSPRLVSAAQPSPKPPRPPRLLSASQLSPPVPSPHAHKPSATPIASTQVNAAAEDIWDNFITSMSPPGPRASAKERGQGQRPVQSTPCSQRSVSHPSSPADSYSVCFTRDSGASSVEGAWTPVQSPAMHRLSAHSPSLQPILETLDVDCAESGSGAHNPLLNQAAAPDRDAHTCSDDGESELLAMLQGCMQSPDVPATPAADAASLQNLQHGPQHSEQSHAAASAWQDGPTQGQLHMSPGKRQRSGGGASASDTCNATVSVFIDDPSSFSAFEEHGGVSVRALSEPPSLEPSFEPSCCGASFEPSLDLDSSRDFIEKTNASDGEGGLGQLLALGIDEAMNPDSTPTVDVNDRERSVHDAEQASSANAIQHSEMPSNEHGRTASGVLLEDEGVCEVGATLVQQAAQAAKEEMRQHWVVKSE